MLCYIIRGGIVPYNLVVNENIKTRISLYSRLGM